MPNKKTIEDRSNTGRFSNLFGRGFPKRTLELSFTRSPSSKRAKKPETSRSSISSDLRKLSKNTNGTLEKIKKDLSVFNAYPVTYKQRVELTALYWKHIYVASVSLIQTYSKEGTMPDDAQRAQLLDLSIENLRHIRRSYELLFMHDYSLPNWRYGKARKQLFDSSFRIMEIVHLEQQVAALRYRPLAANSWQSLNKIFSIMDAYEHVGFEQLLTRSMIRPEGAKKYGTIKEFYLRVQLAGYFDLLRYPTLQQHSLDAYIGAQVKKLTVSELEKDSELDSNTLLIGDNQDHAPKLQSRFSEQNFPGKVVNITSLKSNIATLLKERIQVTDIKNSSISKTSGLLKIPANFTSLLFLMYTKISGRLGEDTPAHTREASDIVLYCGFKECFQLKVDDQRPPEQRRILAEYLAERSSFIGEDEKSVATTLWHKLYSDTKTILLQTEETRYSIQMSVGWLTAYSYGGRNGRLHTIAAVSKFERLSNRQINIELKIIGDHAEAVRFIDLNAETEDSKQRKCPAFLLEGSGQWRMIVHSNHVSKRLRDIQLLRNGKIIELSLGNLQMATQEFSVFRLTGAAIASLEPLFKESVSVEVKQQLFA
ncbi:MAG: hypothetical protein AB8B95_01985 [Pseudohongiellaceae bacterium]